jgi:hypothetical protein
VANHISDRAAGGAREKPMSSPIALLDRIRQHGRAWQDLARQYGVTNPDPPWKTWMYATCEALAVGGYLDPVERRQAEDELAETVYGDVPQPERQLLALVHTMICRGLLREDDLIRRMEETSSRLHDG